MFECFLLRSHVNEIDLNLKILMVLVTSFISQLNDLIINAWVFVFKITYKWNRFKFKSINCTHWTIWLLLLTRSAFQLHVFVWFIFVFTLNYLFETFFFPMIYITHSHYSTLAILNSMNNIYTSDLFNKFHGGKELTNLTSFTFISETSSKI